MAEKSNTVNFIDRVHSFAHEISANPDKHQAFVLLAIDKDLTESDKSNEVIAMSGSDVILSKLLADFFRNPNVEPLIRRAIHYAATADFLDMIRKVSDQVKTNEPDPKKEEKIENQI